MMKVRLAHSLVGKGQGVCQQKSAQYNHANLLPVKRKARIYVTRRVHSKNQANSPTKKSGVSISIFQREHTKARFTDHL